MNTQTHTIWIDVDNSPHVPLFAPVIRHYRENGVEVVVTARDHSQTVELLDLHGFGGTYTVVGKHYGGNKLAKTWGLIVRASRLVSYIADRKTQPAVAISHGSRAMVLAAKWLRIPVITMYDYEWTETVLFNRFSDRVLVPEVIPDALLDEHRLPEAKRVKYPGIKEELYVRGFEPEIDFRKRCFSEYGLSASDDGVLVLMRPPAASANYHSAQSELLFGHTLNRLADSRGTQTIVVARTRVQANDIRASLKGSNNIHVLDRAVNGLNLINAADLVISGGGTMNREAVLLGVPVYSIFAGRQGALDKQMEGEGLMTFIRQPDDVAKIRLATRDRSAPPPILTDRVEKFVIEQINGYLGADNAQTISKV